MDKYTHLLFVQNFVLLWTILNLWCVCTVRPYRFKITLPNTDQVHDKNICESPRVISFKHSSLVPVDGSHKVQNMSEWFLILYLLNFYTT